MKQSSFLDFILNLKGVLMIFNFEKLLSASAFEAIYGNIVKKCSHANFAWNILLNYRVSHMYLNGSRMPLGESGVIVHQF